MYWKVEKTSHNYELVIVLHPKVSEEDTKTFFKKLKEAIEKKFSGTWFKLHTWGERTLANPVDKIDVGTYFHLLYKSHPKCPQELERLMKIHDGVLRYMHSKIDSRIPMEKHLDNYHTLLAKVQEDVEKKLSKKAEKGYASV